MYQVDPFGERRQDLRQAWMTAMQIAATSPSQISDSDLSEMITALRTYLKVHENNEETVDLTAVERVKANAVNR